MPPKRAKKNASDVSNDAITAFPAPPTTHATRPDEAHTPEQSPRKPGTGITQAQKQALIDNLQLEITERARKLRAQYAMQAQGLRLRLEVRVNRIPTALRKRKLQDLLDEHAGKAEPKPAPAVPAKAPAQSEDVEGRPRKAAKRTIEHTSAADASTEDKENAAPAPPQSQDLPVTKKRAKTVAQPATANTKAARTASRAANPRPLQPSTVLSPKSHNSRTLPRSPIKASGIASPEKALPARPTNAAKPAAPRAASRQQPAKKAAPVREEGKERSSGVSDSSAGTTIVHKAATGAKGRVAAAAKKTAAVGRAAVGVGGKKAGAARKETVPPPPSGGRMLRKRG